MSLSPAELKEFLDEKYDLYNRPEFIVNDPISVPHNFAKKEDIEISGFLTAAISWGKRKSIINNAKRLFEWMDHAPFDFITSFEEQDLKPFQKYVHRTFNGEDCTYFLKSLKNIYQNHGGLESVFSQPIKSGESIINSIVHLNKVFFELDHPQRTRKHIANPQKKASAKRIHMFLRWMVRKDNRGVDFGIWKDIKPYELLCPLDVHSGNVARKLGILKRKSNDLQAVIELTENLKKFDHSDPVKYDFALFGLGIFEKF
jgi:uncharacterized protein (TIGR02757 family)